MSDPEKQQLRQGLKQRRHVLENRSLKEQALIERLLRYLDRIDMQCLALYWPIGDEIDLRPMAKDLRDQGTQLALPVVLATHHPLIFRQWQTDQPLSQDIFKIASPGPNAPNISPDVILVPLLGFTKERHRLGYGGGFYDRTLEKLRSSNQILAIGVGFDEQQLDHIPIDPFDQKLDCIVTPSQTF